MLSKNTKTKSALWYRHFMYKKYCNIPYDKENVEDRFYNTYLSNIFINKEIKYEDFKKSNSKIGTYYKYYEQLDCEGSFKNLAYQSKNEDIKMYEEKQTNHLNKMLKKFVLSNIEKDEGLKTTYLYEKERIKRKWIKK